MQPQGFWHHEAVVKVIEILGLSHYVQRQQNVFESRLGPFISIAKIYFFHSLRDRSLSRSFLVLAVLSKLLQNYLKVLVRLLGLWTFRLFVLKVGHHVLLNLLCYVSISTVSAGLAAVCHNHF